MKSEGGFLSGEVFGDLPGLLGRALDFLLPPLCFGCGCEVEVQGGLCPSCWAELRFITNPYCASCGLPFAHDMPEGVLCASCHSKKPRFEAARAAIAYDSQSRPLVLAFKHGGRTEGLKTMAKWLKSAAGDFLDEVDLIVPVPIHRVRLLTRTFNQSALMTSALADLTGLAADPFILEKIRNTKSQGGLSRLQREQNVRAAFRVAPGRAQEIRGKTLLLVDDVLTTGATVENCTLALQKAGARSIYVLTLARVVEPGRKNPATRKKPSLEKS